MGRVGGRAWRCTLRARARPSTPCSASPAAPFASSGASALALAALGPTPLTLKSQVRRDDKLHAPLPAALRQLVELLHPEAHAEVRHRHWVTIDLRTQRRGRKGRVERGVGLGGCMAGWQGGMLTRVLAHSRGVAVDQVCHDLKTDSKGASLDLFGCQGKGGLVNSVAAPFR